MNGVSVQSWRTLLAWLIAPLCIHCGDSLRRPASGPMPATLQYQPVDYPPPPARIELVPDDPGEPCVWLDGHYEWTGRRWQWSEGAWVEAPLACYRVPMAMLRRGDELLYAPPQWVPLGGESAGSTQRSCPAAQVCGEGPRGNNK